MNSLLKTLTLLAALAAAPAFAADPPATSSPAAKPPAAAPKADGQTIQGCPGMHGSGAASGSTQGDHHHCMGANGHHHGHGHHHGAAPPADQPKPKG